MEHLFLFDGAHQPCPWELDYFSTALSTQMNFKRHTFTTFTSALKKFLLDSTIYFLRAGN